MPQHRFLVTGSAGFIGYHLAAALSRDADAHVFGVDNFIRGENDEAYRALGRRPNVTLLDIDLNDEAAVGALPDDIDVVYHLAALNGTQNFYERPLDVLRCCTLPTFNLWAKYGPAGRLRRFVYAGTSEAYAAMVTLFGWEVPTGEDVPLGIDDPHNPRWSYGASKLHGEVLTANAGRQFGVPFTIIRYHNVYGPRMGDKHVVPDFLMRAGRGVLELHGHEDTRAFLYIDDAVEATMLAADCEALRNEVVNIGGSREIRIRELGELMMRAAGLRGEIKLFDSPKGSVRRRAPKLEKLRAATGFVERWTLERGLEQTCRYYLPGDPALGGRAAADA